MSRSTSECLCAWHFVVTLRRGNESWHSRDLLPVGTEEDWDELNANPDFRTARRWEIEAALMASWNGLSLAELLFLFVLISLSLLACLSGCLSPSPSLSFSSSPPILIVLSLSSSSLSTSLTLSSPTSPFFPLLPFPLVFILFLFVLLPPLASLRLEVTCGQILMF